MPTFRNHTHCQVARKANIRPKLVNKYVFSNAFLPTLKTNFFGNDSDSIDGNTSHNRLLNRKK